MYYSNIMKFHTKTRKKYKKFFFPIFFLLTSIHHSNVQIQCKYLCYRINISQSAYESREKKNCLFKFSVNEVKFIIFVNRHDKTKCTKIHHFRYGIACFCLMLFCFNLNDSSFNGESHFYGKTNSNIKR